MDQRRASLARNAGSRLLCSSRAASRARDSMAYPDVFLIGVTSASLALAAMIAATSRRKRLPVLRGITARNASKYASSRSLSALGGNSSATSHDSALLTDASPSGFYPSTVSCAAGGANASHYFASWLKSVNLNVRNIDEAAVDRAAIFARPGGGH